MITSEEATVILYKAVGKRERDAIAHGGWQSFVLRRPFLPVFFPEASKDTAVFIASEYHTHNGASGFLGYLMRCHVREAFLVKCYLSTDFRDGHQEYHVWPKDWAELNAQIVGSIEVVAEFRPEQTS